MTDRAHILVVDDEPDIRDLVKEILEDEGFAVSVAEDAPGAREARRARRPDLVLLDIWMPETDGISLLKEWAQTSGPDTPVVMMSGHATVETAVEATRLGAYDFIEKPLSTPRLLLAVRHALESAQLKQENQGLRREADSVIEPLGRSRVMAELREQIQRTAQHDAPVLITGESGAGKEVCARYLHRLSSRGPGPFVRVPISGSSDHDAAVLLFGAEHDEQVHFGSLEQANGGTLLLEDLVDLEPSAQTRLLSALTHGSFLRAGGHESVRFNARVVAATTHRPAEALEAGRLRGDLYYQLNVVPLHVPALRDHREDVPELLSHYIELLASKEGLPYRRFSVGAQNRLRNHGWPGNIRELKNLVHRLLILGSGADIGQDEIEAALGAVPSASSDETDGTNLPLKAAREQFEREYLERQIRALGGNISRVATKIGMERTHLYRKLKALGIDPKRTARH